jgi:hypothetical protein
MDMLRAGVAQSVWRLGYGLDDRGSILGGVMMRLFYSSPPLPDRLLSNATWNFLPGGKAAGA